MEDQNNVIDQQQPVNVRIVPGYVRENLVDPETGRTTPGPIRRNPGVHHINRNDPCPCGSGKKFKSCCHKRERDKQAVARLRAWSDSTHSTSRRMPATETTPPATTPEPATC